MLLLLCLIFNICVDHFPLPPHLRDAWSLIRHTAPANTLYRHRPTTVVFPDAAQPAASSTCQADCSGLTNALLSHSYHLEEGQLAMLFRAKRPLARHYHSAILAERGFQRIHRTNEILPGDILAIRYEPSAKNTGHVMIAASRPIWRQIPFRRSSNTVARYGWHVLIIDASSGNRGTGDLRFPGTDPITGQPLTQKLTGLGIGWYTLPTPNALTTVDFPTDTALIGPESTPTPKRPLVIGRLSPAAFRASDPPARIDDNTQSSHD